MISTPRPRAEGDPARVLLVDDQALFRSAVAGLLDQEPDFDVVGEAANGLEGVEQARALRPDLVVMDVEMPVMDGVEAARIMREQMAATKLIMLTVCEDDEKLLAAVRLGVHGYLLKDMRPAQLFDMLRSALRDETPVSPALVGRLLAELRSTPTGALPSTGPAGPAAPALSQRELEIMRLVADGLTNREIGSRLSITEGTVKNHVHNALHKLDMDNRIQAAAYIVRQGLGLPAHG